MEKITTSYLKLSAKLKKRSYVVNFASVVHSAKSFLIFMPDAPNDFDIAKQFIEKLEQDFSSAKFIILSKQDYESALNEQKQHGTIFVSSDDINSFGLPKRKLQHKVMATNFDIAIDLNQDFHLLSTFLCQKSSAILKMCLDNQHRQPFYNFYFRCNMEEDLSITYQKFLSYIDNCAHRSQKEYRH